MRLREKYLTILKSNQRKTKGFRYTVPSSKVYPYQWLWDSCFHAIIYTHFDLDYAKDEIRSLLAGQWPDGMIPHMIYWRQTKKHRLDWGTRKNTSSITQPPMVAYAVERIYQKTHDFDFVQEVLDKLHKYYKWLDKDRAYSNLPIIIHPWESGEDDFIAWDEIYGLDNPSQNVIMRKKLEILKEYNKTRHSPRKFARQNIFNVRCLLFISVYLRNLKSMLSLTRVIESKHYPYYKYLIPKVEKSFRKILYNREERLFASVYNDNKSIVNIKNSSIFLPLFAHIATKPQAEKLVKYLLDENKFWLKYPVPTLSADNIYFQPNRYWRGSTWININWFIAQGLKDYGYHQVAEDLKVATIKMIKKSGFREYYNPVTGLGLGAENFTWPGLIFDM
jgi:glycogen debranching enzyme